MYYRVLLFSLFCALLCITYAASADNVSLFNVKTKKEQLQSSAYSLIKHYCMADDEHVSQPDETMPKPVDGLKATIGYGSDRALSDYAWYLMVHSGRALAGNEEATQIVKEALLAWSSANALHKTEEIHDAYYALKRGLLPIINSYLIIQDELTSAQQKQIETWIDPLVRRIDKKFDGDVDENNHRYLADSVLAFWGDVIGDDTLYAKGRERFMAALHQMRPDGSLPLETRRGARALWYMRQAITNLLVMAEVYYNNGDASLYEANIKGKSLSLLVNYFISAIRNPLILHRYTAENYIPGPSDDFLNQDLQFLHTRGGRRHYMSFAHKYLERTDENDLSHQRLKALVEDTAFRELPLIDDFAGGNATCYWGQP